MGKTMQWEIKEKKQSFHKIKLQLTYSYNTLSSTFLFSHAN